MTADFYSCTWMYLKSELQFSLPKIPPFVFRDPLFCGNSFFGGAGEVPENHGKLWVQ